MYFKSNYFISAFQSCLSIQANSHLVNSPHFCQQSYQPTNPIFKFVNPVSNPPLLDIFPQSKNRDYPSGLEPDLKPRKAFICLSYYTLNYSPLTSILPSQRVIIRLFEGTSLKVAEMTGFKDLFTLRQTFDI